MRNPGQRPGIADGKKKISLEGCTPAKMAAGAALKEDKKQENVLRWMQNGLKAQSNPTKEGLRLAQGKVSEANDTLGKRPYHVSRPARAKA